MGAVTDDQVQEEALDVKLRKTARRPTEDEVRRHNVTHLPFRDWCPECIAGRAKDFQHQRREELREGALPEVHFDYCFLRNET